MAEAVNYLYRNLRLNLLNKLIYLLFINNYLLLLQDKFKIYQLCQRQAT